MPERLTSDQIREKYPDQWVALTDIDFKPGSTSNFYTAVVVCGMTDEEYPNKCLEYTLQGKDYLYVRTADTGYWVGVLDCPDLQFEVVPPISQ